MLKATDVAQVFLGLCFLSLINCNPGEHANLRSDWPP